MTYWDNVTHHTDTSDIWMGHPAVRAAINRRVSGNAGEWSVAALAKVLADRLPLESALSIGCGTGGLERSLMEEGIARRITGIDMSEPALEEARRLGPGIDYHASDARTFLEGKSFDAIFFHQSLHHFDDLDDLMSRVAGALRPNGILYIDEYVGPSRDEWPWWRLAMPNLVYRGLPAGTRRAKIVRAPINYEDPTEAIRSSQIVDAVTRRFDVVHRRDYGGNLLALLYPNMNRASPRFNEAVEQLIRVEDWILARRMRSFYTVMLLSSRA
jgi:SAM-dependent methyltransferase